MPLTALDLSPIDIPPPPALAEPPPDDAGEFERAEAVMIRLCNDFALSPSCLFAAMVGAIRRGEVPVMFSNEITIAPIVEVAARRHTARVWDQGAGQWVPLAETLIDTAAARAVIGARWIARAPFAPPTAGELADETAWAAWQTDAPFRLLDDAPPCDPPLTANLAREFVAQSVLLNLVPIAQRIAPALFCPVGLAGGPLVAGWQDTGGGTIEPEGGIVRIAPAVALVERQTVLDCPHPVLVHLPSLHRLLLDVLADRVPRPAASVFARLPPVST